MLHKDFNDVPLLFPTGIPNVSMNRQKRNTSLNRTKPYLSIVHPFNVCGVSCLYFSFFFRFRVCWLKHVMRLMSSFLFAVNTCAKIFPLGFWFWPGFYFLFCMRPICGSTFRILLLYCSFTSHALWTEQSIVGLFLTISEFRVRKMSSRSKSQFLSQRFNHYSIQKAATL